MLRPKSSPLRRPHCLLGPLLLAAACGCMGPRLIRETPDGGVISIPNNSNQWPTYYRNRADYLMRQKCPEGYAIEREEAVVDNPAARDGRKPYEHFEYSGGYQRITNYAREEYHITFHCAGTQRVVPAKSGAPGAAPPRPPAASPRAPAKRDDKDELPPPRPFLSPKHPEGNP